MLLHPSHGGVATTVGVFNSRVITVMATHPMPQRQKTTGLVKTVQEWNNGGENAGLCAPIQAGQAGMSLELKSDKDWGSTKFVVIVYIRLSSAGIVLAQGLGPSINMYMSWCCFTRTCSQRA